MKIGIFSDLHLRKGGKKVEGIWDSYLLDGINILREVFEIFDKNNVELFIFAGDFFNDKYLLDSRAIYAISKIFQEVKIEGYFLVGNHDKYIEQITSLELFGLRNFKVISIPKVVKIKDKKFVFIPYTKEINKIKIPDGDILFLHQLLLNFPIIFSRPPEEELFNWSDYSNKFEWIFSGHCHKMYKIKNVVQIGSVLQLNFNDENEQKGVWIFDLDKNELEFIQTNCKKYKTVYSISEINDENCYYRLIINEEELKKIQNLPDNVLQVLVAKKDENKKEILKVSQNEFNLEKILKEYVDKTIETKKDKYFEIAKKLLFDL